MPVRAQCGQAWDDVKCDLPAGHVSAHRARIDDSFAWWAKGSQRCIADRPGDEERGETPKTLSQGGWTRQRGPFRGR
jgi:hypothetical protein